VSDALHGHRKEIFPRFEHSFRLSWKERLVHFHYVMLHVSLAWGKNFSLVDFLKNVLRPLLSIKPTVLSEQNRELCKSVMRCDKLCLLYKSREQHLPSPLSQHDYLIQISYVDRK